VNHLEPKRHTGLERSQPALGARTVAEIRAYVLSKVSSGSEREVCKMMAEYPFVSDVDIIYGDYDIIAKIEVRNLQQLDFFIDKIRMIPSITFTSTVIVGRMYKDHGKPVMREEP